MARSDNGSTKVVACSSNSATARPSPSVHRWVGGFHLLLAQRLRSTTSFAAELARGLVLIAPAVDFHRSPDVAALHVATSSSSLKRRVTGNARPNIRMSLYLITRQLIEEGRNHLLLGGLIETGCPVRILQGVKDEDVPWEHAVSLVSRIARDDVVLTLVKDGDHRLSRPEDIERMLAAVGEFN